VNIHGRLSKQFSGSQAAYETIFKFPVSYWRDGTSTLKRVTEKLSQLLSDFKEASKNFILLWIFFKNRRPRSVKIISDCS
jgi:hypothetical protein